MKPTTIDYEMVFGIFAVALSMPSPSKATRDRRPAWLVERRRFPPRPVKRPIEVVAYERRKRAEKRERKANRRRTDATD